MKSEDLIDRAVTATRDEPLDPGVVEAAGARVWNRLASELAAEPEADPGGSESNHRIQGCAGFRALIPAYLAGALTESKRLLVEDHSRECLGCRKALAAARRADEPTAAASRESGTATPWRRWALAAGLAGTALLGGWLVARNGWVPFAAGPSAEVRSIQGELLVVGAERSRVAVAGERLGRDQAVRTAKGSGALLTLADGSRVELGERSELALDRRWDGTVLRLGRGSLIVEAAEQRRGHLYVETGDCLVSVVGTVFSVNHGAKGSRVSVIDGEVRVSQGAELAVLRPGQQLTTNARLSAVPLENEIAWSRDAARYRERLAALRALGQELDQTLVAADRTSTRLLDLAPAGTAVYVALPNLSQSLADAWQIVEQRVGENAALAEWWQERFGEGDAEREISEVLAELRRFGGELGAEIVVALDLGADPGSEAPVVLAEVTDPQRFAPLLDEEIARLNASAEEGVVIRRIADPSAEPGGSGESHELLVWLAGDLLVVSPSAERLATIEGELEGGGNPFVDTPFHARLAEVYGEGTGWLLGVDLASVLAHQQATAPEGEAAGLAAERLGLTEVDHLVLDSRSAAGETQHRAVLAFADDRRGLASWLAEPAPVGALDFVSPDAQLAVAGLLKEPAAMLDDLLALISADDAAALARLAEFEAAHGLSLREDLAATLGGDFAFAFDGPWLPEPSWKLVLEVADSARLQATLATLVEVWNREAEAQERPQLRLSQEAVDGTIVRTLSLADGRELAHLLFADGYLVAGPSRALLVESIAQRAAGVTLAASQRFLDLLPEDGEIHFSGIAYQNLGGSLGALGSLLPDAEGAGAEQQAQLEAVLADSGPSLAVAYGAARRITVVTRGGEGLLGLSLGRLLALSDLADGEGATAAAPASAALGGETRPGPRT